MTTEEKLYREIDKLIVLMQIAEESTIELNDLDQYYCIEQLWHKESRWSPTAKNARSSAYGIPQILNMKETNPFKQIDRGLRYIEHRHGTPCQALAFHNRKGYY